MDELKRLRNSRKGYRIHLTKLLLKAKEAIELLQTSEAQGNTAALSDIRRQLQRKDDIISELDTQIVPLITDEEELVADVCEAEEIKESLLTTISQITQLLETRPPPIEPQLPTLQSSVNPKLPQPQSSANTEVVQPQPNEQSSTEQMEETYTAQPLHSTQPRPVRLGVTHLPKLNIPTFSGNQLHWQSFWDCFEAAVDQNPSISEVQKLSYLRSQLQGSALQVIAGLSLTNSNYQHSITLLKERYGETSKQVDAHMKALIALSSPANTLAALQQFHDTVEGHIRCLQSLGTPPERYESMLVPTLQSKLSPETLRNLARANGTEQWTLCKLQRAIIQEIRVLQMGADPSPYYSNPPTPTASFLTNADRKPKSNKESQKKLSCVFCKGPHTPTACDVVKDTKKRIDIVRHNMLCFNCLGRHKISQCKSKYRCRRCNHRHHTSICTDSRPAVDPSIQVPTTSADTSDNATHTNPTSDTTSMTTLASESFSPPTNTVLLLKTAVATLTSDTTEVEANVLFDEGSQRSFITEDLARALSLTPHHKEDVHLSSFGSRQPLNKTMEVAHINIKTIMGETVPISVLIVPTIATPLRNTIQTSVTQLPHLYGLQLAHPITREDSFKISLLIGTDHYWDLVEDHIVRGNGPTAMSSKLGYLLSGPLPIEDSTTPTHTNSFHIGAHNSNECNLEQFWELESTGTNSNHDTDKSFLAEYSKTCISRQPDGSYCAKLPWKSDHPPLPSNREICWKRARSLIHRLAQTPELLQTYDKIITDQAKRGFIEKVLDHTDHPSKTHYIPHHCVKKNSATTPIRIVYDCSCRQSSLHPSLNDCLLPGPHFLNDLCAVLLRFRTYNYAISADIEKAFLHITLHDTDRDYTRFFWLKDISNPKGQLDIYRFKRVLFGAVSSPFVLCATLHHHLQQHHTPIALDILHNLYVDNVLSGCPTENDIVHYYHNARSLLSEACFNLRSWVTNSQQLFAITQKEQTADSVTPNNILGILWNPHSDQLSLASKGPSTTGNLLTTKRELLQESSKIFDPIGLAAPVTIQAKLLIQKIWTQRIEWDEPLGSDLAQEWHQIAMDLRQLHQFSINRKYFRSFDVSCMELHAFSDASPKAYGAVVYLRSQAHTTFIMAKSRVAPLKPQTLPRLELMGALIAARLTKFVINSLELASIPVNMWVDSQIALYWIYSNKRLPQFVAHRVTEMNHLLPFASWKYCPSSNNPADLLTRGLTFQQFQSSTLWFNGPTWLCNKQEWPSWNCESSISHLHAVAAIAEPFVPTEQPPTTGLHFLISVKRFSKLRKLLTVTSYVHRFIHNQRNPNAQQRGPITAQELTQANNAWIYSCQSETYWKEVKNLSNPKQKRLPLVRQLRLFLDGKGFLRCGGRIHNAPLTEDAKFPYLLPPRHPFTTLLVYSIHTQLYHAGVNTTVTTIRQSYWIPTARQFVKTLLHRCTTCRRQCGKPYMNPDPAPLPKHRLQDLPPFTVTGVDFTGALYVHNNNEEQKVYICLFTCANTRAIHLEVVTDLSMKTFLLAFRRFASRRSLPQVMMSDNASTFTSAAEELTRLLESENLSTSLAAHGVVWKFIPKKAPWFGGFWERLIGLTKASLKKVLGRSHISLPVLQTMITEIEAVLNDRPLTYTSSDIADPQPLTPAHLLHGRRMIRLPYECPTDDLSDLDYDSSQLQKRAKVQTHLLQSFQSRWKHEYLTALREYHRTTGHNHQQIKVGDVVIVHDDGPRVNWRLAVVTKLLIGGDGFTRAVEIRTSTGTTNRPIAKLYPLEVHSTEESSSQISEESNSSTQVPESTSSEVTPDERPPVRQSAKRAVEQMSQWVETLRAPPEDVET